MADDDFLLVEVKIQETVLLAFDRNSELVYPIFQIICMGAAKVIAKFSQEINLAKHKGEFIFLV